VLHPTTTDLSAELGRRSLSRFVREAWPSMEPAATFVPGWHIDAICEHLEAVTRGEIRLLLINVPPRHGKSLTVSVAWPAWAWIARPELRWLFASYGQHLATRDSDRMRRLVSSPWYRERWGDCYQLRETPNQVIRFENDRGGVRLATSVGGAATGEGGDIIVIDDPHKADNVQSPTQRQQVIDWYDGVMSTRLSDPRGGAIVVIGQRLHESDLFGHLIARGDAEHLCLPAEYEPAHPHLWPGDPRTEPGQLLWGAHHDRASVERQKRSLGSYNAAGQLQQLPAPLRGGIFNREWWKYYDPVEGYPEFDRVLQSWDLSFTDGPTSDYVVGQVWGIKGPDKYLLRQYRERATFVETIRAIEEMERLVTTQFPGRRGHGILIEKAANGPAVISHLKRKIPSILAIVPKGDKVTRAHAASTHVEAGNVYLPGAANSNNTGYDRARTEQWVQTFVDEAASFPKAAHDDQVDALTQALARADNPGPRIRVLGP